MNPGSPGLKVLVERGKETIDPAEINVVGRFVDARRRGDPGQAGQVRPVPEARRGLGVASPTTSPPTSSTSSRPWSCSTPRNGDRVLGIDPETGLDVVAKAGRFGPYVQVGEMPEGKGKVKPEDKPKTASLFKTMTVERLTFDDAMQLLSLPRVVGADPADGGRDPGQNGRYGPYLTKEFTDETGAAKPRPARSRPRSRSSTSPSTRRSRSWPSPSGAGTRRSPRRCASSASTRSRRSRW